MAPESLASLLRLLYFAEATFASVQVAEPNDRLVPFSVSSPAGDERLHPLQSCRSALPTQGQQKVDRRRTPVNTSRHKAAD